MENCRPIASLGPLVVSLMVLLLRGATRQGPRLISYLGTVGSPRRCHSGRGTGKREERVYGESVREGIMCRLPSLALPSGVTCNAAAPEGGQVRCVGARKR